jgi:hypothetical protein
MAAELLLDRRCSVEHLACLRQQHAAVIVDDEALANPVEQDDVEKRFELVECGTCRRLR